MGAFKQDITCCTLEFTMEHSSSAREFIPTSAYLKICWSAKLGRFSQVIFLSILILGIQNL